MAMSDLLLSCFHRLKLTFGETNGCQYLWNKPTQNFKFNILNPKVV